MRYYPIFMDLRGQRCVVVGGGGVAERQVRSLWRAGAMVHVISPDLTPGLALLAAKNRIKITPRTYREGDLGRPLLVFAATDDLAAQKQIREHAARAGAHVTSVGSRVHSTFLVPASFEQGDLQVAISTSGASPALARRLRRHLQVTIGREYRPYVRFLQEARRQIMRTILTQQERAKVFRQLAGGAVLDWFRTDAPRRTLGDVGKMLEKLGVKIPIEKQRRNSKSMSRVKSEKQRGQGRSNS